MVSAVDTEKTPLEMAEQAHEATVGDEATTTGDEVVGAAEDLQIWVFLNHVRIIYNVRCFW